MKHHLFTLSFESACPDPDQWAKRYSSGPFIVSACPNCKCKQYMKQFPPDTRRVQVSYVPVPVAETYTQPLFGESPHGDVSTQTHI